MVTTPVPLSARRLRRSAADSSDPASHLVVTCDECGDRFDIAHAPNVVAVALATRQAKWLIDQFTWDHIQETKHKGSIKMPAL